MLACAASVACGGLGQPPTVDEHASVGARAAALLGEAIRIDTTNPPGNEASLAEHLALFLRRGGVDAEVIPLPEPES